MTINDSLSKSDQQPLVAQRAGRNSDVWSKDFSLSHVQRTWLLRDYALELKSIFGRAYATPDVVSIDFAIRMIIPWSEMAVILAKGLTLRCWSYSDISTREQNQLSIQNMQVRGAP